MMISIILHTNHINNDNLNIVSIDECKFEFLIEKESSISESYNVGLRRATGDYVWFLTDDDVVDYSTFQFVENIIKNKKSDVFVFDYCIRYLDGTTEFNYANTYHSLSNQFISMIIQNRFAPFLCNKLFKKEVLINNNLKFNTNLSVFYDKLFMLSLYHSITLHTTYCNVNIVTHQLKMRSADYHFAMCDISKDSIQEYPIYYNLIKTILGDEFKDLIEQTTLEYKRNLYKLGLLQLNMFNSFCKTPFRLLWKPIFTIKESLLLSFNYFNFIL